jgi:hypothetical protein
LKYRTNGGRGLTATMTPPSCQIRSKRLASSFRRSAADGSVCQKRAKSESSASAWRLAAYRLSLARYGLAERADLFDAFDVTVRGTGRGELRCPLSGARTRSAHCGDTQLG